MFFKKSPTSLTIAVQGCCHGDLNRIYKTVAEMEKKENTKASALICCGDFQSLRSRNDFVSLNVPDKYKELGDFHEYYSGTRKAPILTVFIGGNHEASASLHDLFYGGWVAPNIYYLGRAGSVILNVKGSRIRISGLSGIYNQQSYDLPHNETTPYNRSHLRSIYHVRRSDVYKLSLLPSADIFLSHDWPAGIGLEGDTEELLRRKAFLRKEIYDGTLGSQPARILLNGIKPKLWFSAHLHCKFKAAVYHRKEGGEVGQDNVDAGIDPNEINIDVDGRPGADSGDDDDHHYDDIDPDADEICLPGNSPGRAIPAAFEKASQSSHHSSQSLQKMSTVFHGLESECPDSNGLMGDLTAQMTKFLSLDKCLPRRKFVELVTVEPNEELEEVQVGGNAYGGGGTYYSEGDDNEIDVDVDSHGESENDDAQVDSAKSVRNGEEHQQQHHHHHHQQQQQQQEPYLEYDATWLTILKLTNHLSSRVRLPPSTIPPLFTPISARGTFSAHLTSVISSVISSSPTRSLKIPASTFIRTVDPESVVAQSPSGRGTGGNGTIGNPQTDWIVEVLRIGHRVTEGYRGFGGWVGGGGEKLERQGKRFCPDVSGGGDRNEEEDGQKAIDDNEIDIG